MSESKRLTREDFSNVWKDDQNTLPSGLKLDLVEHLRRQRLSAEWVNAKQKLVQTMKLEQFTDDQEVKILDVGCGLGIDLMIVAEEASRLGKTVTITGLDQNSAMLDEATKLYEEQKDRLSSKVSVQIVRGDLLQMPFEGETFDIVRSDITLQHVDLPKALEEIKRVLKVNGRLIALEGGNANLFGPDEAMLKVYETILPPRKDGGTGVVMHFLLPKLDFELRSSNPIGFIQTGEFLASQDKDWVKMRGVGEMLVSKGVLTQEQSQDFQQRYINACETNQVLAAGILFVIEAVKCK